MKNCIGIGRRGKAVPGLVCLCTYAAYDLTNLATVKDWPLIVTVVGLVWGTVLCGTVAWAGYLVSSRFA